MALRLFVADDHPAIVDAVVRFLAANDEVEIAGTAGDGTEALERIDESRPDVAVLDVRMPGMGGIEVARRLATESSTTGVILYTGYAERSLVVEAIDAGAHGFVLKESPLADLLRAVRLVAEGRTYVDPVLASVLAGPDAAARIPGLTKREREVLRLLADGMRNEQVGRELSISPLTVRTHIEKAMSKLEADTRTQAVANALRMSLIE
ncbi:MAG TPA: response regulator transcription factor [Gaiellaceae bacterium]